MISPLRTKPTEQYQPISPPKNTLYSRISYYFQCFDRGKHYRILPIGTALNIEIPEKSFSSNGSSSFFVVEDSNRQSSKMFISDVSSSSSSIGEDSKEEDSEISDVFSSSEKSFNTEQVHVKAKKRLQKNPSELEKEQIAAIRKKETSTEKILGKIDKICKRIQTAHELIKEGFILDYETFNYCETKLDQVKQVMKKIHEISYTMHQKELSVLENLTGVVEKDLLLMLKTSLTLNVAKYRIKASLAAILTNETEKIWNSLYNKITFDLNFFQEAKMQLKIQETEIYDLEQKLPFEWERLNDDEQEQIYSRLCQIIEGNSHFSFF
jgi:hypothetical protein